jgi:4'-phosphopantetheinyl transferase
VFLEITGISEAVNMDLLKLVSTDRQKKLCNFKFEIDRKLSLYAELLVRCQICRELNIANRKITFSINKNGKPFLDNHPEFFFNISHTHNAIAVAFSDDEIGIDIERMQTLNLGIAKRFFAPEENHYVRSQINRDYAFCEMWTKKEAYIKYMGTGLSTPLDSFNVLSDEISPMLYSIQLGRYFITSCCRPIKCMEPVIETMDETKLHAMVSEIM